MAARPASRGGPGMRGFGNGQPVAAMPMGGMPLGVPAGPGAGGGMMPPGTASKFGRPSTPSSQFNANGMPMQPTVGGMGMRPASRAGGVGAAPVGMRPPTGGYARLNTGQQGVNPMIPLNTSVSVSHRPVTQQGLTGMATKPLGPSRQIADKTYYMNLLRDRINEIMVETDRMKSEMSKAATDNASYAQYERKYEVVIKEVRNLEGQLADFNLALDKVRTNTDVSEIVDMYERLHQRNDNERKAMDDVLMKALSAEKQTKQMQDQIANIHHKAAQRIAELGDDLSQEYADLEDESSHLQQRINEKESLLSELDQRINHHSDALKSQVYQIHHKGMLLKKEHKSLLQRQAELEEETSSEMRPEEMKEKLMSKIKELTAEIGDAEKRTKKMEDQLENMHESIRTKEQDLIEAKKMAQKSSKYEAVYERDRKMQEFIDSFPSLKQQESQQQAQLKETIVALLKHISKGIHLQTNLPDAEKFSDIKQELSFKEQKMKNSKETLELVKKDLEKRREELDKINSLDSKINQELTLLREKMASMTAEMETFVSEEELRERANEVKKNLIVENQRCKKQREHIKSQVQILSHAVEKQKKELANNENHKRISDLEQKLRTYAQTVFQLQEFISTRKRESDYEGIMKEVMTLTNECNSMLVQQYK